MFIKEPEAFASFRDELLFEFEQEASDDLVFEIELCQENEFEEVKKLYDTSTAIINVGSVVANKFMTDLSSGESKLATPDCGYAMVALWCGDESTQPQYYVASKYQLPQVGVLSSISNSRVISYGDSDEIWISAPEESQVLVIVETTDEGSVTSVSYEDQVQECRLLRFRFNTEDYGAYTKIAKVSVFCDEECVEEITYHYIPRVRGSVRLAWIGNWGGIEHYTFPRTNSLSITKGGSVIYEIESMYEANDMVEALSEILSSERVWIINGGEYCEVDVLSDTVELNKKGALSTVEYKIERYD